MLRGRATAEERKDIIASLFGEIRVRDKAILSATLADPQFAPLIASSEDEQVGLAPPDGSRGAQPTFMIEGISELVMELLAA